MPIPAWPGLLAYPEFVLIITIEGVFPEIVGPDLITVLVTITAIYDGTLVGDPELLPGSVVQVFPQEGGVVLSVFANPLNAPGTGPPDKLFSFCHCVPHHVTAVFGKAEAMVWSPNTKEPLDKKAKINTCLLSLADG